MGCFRCLSTSHFIKDCRDPVRCRRCGGYGHRQARCTRSINSRLTPFPRSVSSRHAASMRAVPSAARATPPPPTPNGPQPTPDLFHALTNSYTPLHTVASSNNCSPGLQQPLSPVPSLEGQPATEGDSSPSGEQVQVSATAGPDESIEVDPLVVSDVAVAAPALPPPPLPPPPPHQPTNQTNLLLALVCRVCQLLVLATPGLLRSALPMAGSRALTHFTMGSSTHTQCHHYPPSR